MDTTLVVGIVLATGLFFGELASLVRLPKVTGYLIAGVLLDPQLTHLLPESFAQHTDFVTNLALAFITFSIGGTLRATELRRLGRSIAAITLLEAEITFLVVSLGVALLLPLFVHGVSGGFLSTFLPVGLIIGALASPTDPTGTLAVVHQYKAKGRVTSTILSVSAFDDALGLINFSLAAAAANVMVLHEHFSVGGSIGVPLAQIGGALALGAAFGLLFNLLTKLLWEETAGVFLVMMFALLALCFGVAHLFHCDELLATMTMGLVVTNFNAHRDRVFEIMEYYTEEIVFALFFTLSGMYLNVGIFVSSLALVGLYTFWRTVGKFAGAALGAAATDATPEVRRYTGFGLIPSGGIIVGLALLLKQNPAFHTFADIVLNVIIGATVIHEFAGPLLVQFALRRTREIHA